MGDSSSDIFLLKLLYILVYRAHCWTIYYYHPIVTKDSQSQSDFQCTEHKIIQYLHHCCKKKKYIYKIRVPISIDPVFLIFAELGLKTYFSLTQKSLKRMYAYISWP